MRIAAAVLVFVLYAGACAMPALAAGGATNAGTRPDGQIIVRYKGLAVTPATDASRQSRLEALALRRGARLLPVRQLANGGQVFRIDATAGPSGGDDLLASLRNDPDVASVERDAWLRPAYTQPQWILAEEPGGLRLFSAWPVSAGKGIVVGVVDTGVLDHPDLVPNLVAGYDFISDPAVAADGDGRDADAHDAGDATAQDECGPGEPARDASQHGTVVAGAIAAVNNDDGLVGVAFSSKVMPLRAFGKCGGRVSDIGDAIVWAVGGSVPGLPANGNPVEVLNLSMSGPGTCSPTLQAAIDVADAAGVVVVAAAGNDGADASASMPGNCTKVVTVGASNREGSRSPYSNFGSRLDLLAPGGDEQTNTDPGADVISLWQFGPGLYGYVCCGYGTSFAAAHASGVAALMQRVKVNPPATVASILRNTARSPVLPCPEGCGGGLATASIAVRAAVQPMVYVVGGEGLVEGDDGGLYAHFSVRLSQELATPVTLDVATVDGSANAGSDYDAISLPGLTFAPGQTRREFQVRVHGDTAVESTETFGLKVANVTGAAILIAQADATIVNDDIGVLANGVPVQGLAVNGHGALYYFLDVPAGATHLEFRTSGGTGDLVMALHQDSAGGQAWCFDNGAGATAQCVLESPAPGRWFVELTGLDAFSGVTLTGSYVATNLFLADVSIVEGDAGTKAMIFTGRLVEPQPNAVTFDATITSGTATAGTDFTTTKVDGVTIPAGQLAVTFQVATLGDTTVEANETFNVTLGNVVGATSGDVQATGTLINNDGPTLTLHGGSVAEGPPGFTELPLTVTLSRAASVPVTFSLDSADGTAQEGIDYYRLSARNVTIPAGMLGKVVYLSLPGDNLVEDTETVLVTLSQPTGATILHGNATAYILNDDGPALSVLDASVAEGNAGTKVMLVTVRLSQAASVPVTYSLATAGGTATPGVDYVARSLQGMQIPAGQTTRLHQVTINGDAGIEPNETFLVELDDVVGASKYDWQAIATIYNDDGPTLSVNDVSISEGNAGTKVATFTVFLSQAAAVPISYDIATSNLAATAGSDYVAKSLAGETIPAGQLSKTFTVTLKGDTSVEANETFRVTLSNISEGATLYKNIGTGTITNDD